MRKLLIEVRLPAANLSYDLFVPDSMQIGTLTNLAAAAFSDLSNGVFRASGCSVLCEQETGRSYDPDARVRDTGIRNGTKLLLI